MGTPVSDGLADEDTSAANSAREFGHGTRRTGARGGGGQAGIRSRSRDGGNGAPSVVVEAFADAAALAVARWSGCGER